MSRTVGVFDTSADSGLVVNSLKLEFVALDFITEWHRVGMTSNYIGDYLSYYFGDYRSVSEIISTIANELLENAVKFSEPSTATITVNARQIGNALSFEVSNSTSAASAESFADLLDEVLREDPKALFVRRLTNAHANKNVQTPGVGLVILRKDYGIELAARIDAQQEKDMVRITICTNLKFEKDTIHG